MPKGILDHEKWKRATKEVESGKKKYKDKYAVISTVYQNMGGRYKKKEDEGSDMGKSYKDIENATKVTNEDLVKSVISQTHGETIEKKKATTKKAKKPRPPAKGVETSTTALKLPKKMTKRITLEDIEKLSKGIFGNLFRGKKTRRLLERAKKYLGKKPKKIIPNIGGKFKGRNIKDITRKCATMDDVEAITKGLLGRLARRGAKLATRAVETGGKKLSRFGMGIQGRSMARRGVIPTRAARIGRGIEQAGRFAQKHPGKIAAGVGAVGLAAGMGHLGRRKKRREQQQQQMTAMEMEGKDKKPMGKAESIDAVLERTRELVKGLPTGEAKGKRGKVGKRGVSKALSNGNASKPERRVIKKRKKQ